MGFTTKVQLVDAVVAATKVVLFSVSLAMKMVNDAYRLGSAIHYLNSFFREEVLLSPTGYGPRSESSVSNLPCSTPLKCLLFVY